MFESLQLWHWWVLAIALVALEVTLSGAYFFLWLAGSAAVTGFLAAIPGVPWQAQLAAFAVMALVSLFLWRRFKPSESETDQPALNQRAHRYIGGRFTLNEPIVNGVGKLIVADTTWKITGEDLPEGTQVKVTDVEGVALRVEPIPASTGTD